jgi:hypothetical protein
MPALAQREDIALDPVAILFAVAAMAACALLFGLAPALRIDLDRAQRWLHADGRGQTASRERRQVQHALVVCQVAAALLLLSGAGLLLRSFWRLPACTLACAPKTSSRFRCRSPNGAMPAMPRSGRSTTDCWNASPASMASVTPPS